MNATFFSFMFTNKYEKGLVLSIRDYKEIQQLKIRINEVYETTQFQTHSTIINKGKCWLNPDWFGQPQHPGGQYFNYTHRTIYYPTLEKPYFVEE